jgi:ribosome biogenesis GTP-binding protein YsxC/EngB
MKKYTGRSVIYLSKYCSNIDTGQDKFFPFLNSPLIHSQAMSQFTTTGLHAMCNITNIRSTVPHKQDFQEFVFFGRSNVGKSTLINQLVRREFVEVSKKPGKTKELAFLKIKSTLPTLLVDAPGYGYASDASKNEIMKWGQLIEYYLKHTPNNNQLVMLLIDVLHGFKDTDGMLIKLLHQMKKNFLIVFTKCDRAKEKELDEAI